MIEADIYRWLVAVTQLETVQEPYEGNRPIGDYVAFQFINIRMSEHEHIAKKPLTPLVGEHKAVNHAFLLVSVDITGYQAYNHLAQLKLSFLDWKIRKDILPHSFATVSPFANRSYLNHTSQKNRWGADFEFFITFEHLHEIERLTKFCAHPVAHPSATHNIGWTLPIT